MKKPTTADDYYLRGMAYYFKGNYIAAIEDLTKAISLRDKENVNDYFLRGWAYQAIGNTAAATEDGKKIILLGNGKYAPLKESLVYIDPPNLSNHKQEQKENSE
ncbi:hypothetical protein R83H12_03002 [Fibrobacteria bacterium R8-3-H12]